ncbi:MAG: M16 family metallopeptidase [Bryobacteraceae bacterium]
MRTLSATLPILLTGLVWTAQAQPATGRESVVIRDVKALPSWKSLKFPPLKDIPIPKPLTFTLPNGMRVYLLEDHELPLISGTALVRNGNLFDPPDKRGLAELTGTVMRTGGTNEKSGDDLDVQLENIAASVETQIGESSGRASFSCLRENTDEVLAAFHDVLTSPAFRQDKLDLAETQMRGGIARRNDDAGGILGREFESIVYGRNTPYGWDIEYSDVDNIHRSDLLAFYKRYFFPANIMLAVYGDFSAPAMKEKLEKLFAAWTYSQPSVPPFPPVTAKPAPGIYLAAKTDVTQTFFSVGELGGELRDKDFPALQVAADILGSGFTSRLVDRVRTRLGYAYSINASWAANYDHPGTFRISGSTKSATAADTLAIVREEVEKMRDAEVSDAELRTARDRVLNSFVFFFDRPSKTLNRLVLYDYFGYPKDFIFQYEKAIGAVTRADVLRVARQYWHPKDLTLVAVGNPKEFGKPLTALNLPVHDIDLTIPEPKEPQQPEANVDAESIAKGKQLLQRLQTALGGAEKLASVKDTDWSADVSLQAGPGGVMKAKQRNLLLLPNQLRQEQVLPFGKMTVYSDGKTGWMASPQGVMPMNPAVIHQVQGEIFRNLFSLALSDRDASRTVNAVDGDTMEISDKAGNRVRLVLDAKTGLPTKEIYRGSGGMGRPSEVEENLSGWRDVSGIKVPFQISIMQSGRKATEIAVTDYKLNTGLTPEDLSKKP